MSRHPKPSSLLDRIHIARICDLLTYEKTDPAQVETVAQDLLQSEILRDPLIVDPARSLLVDGHHRAEALSALGIKLVPFFGVDYLGDEVSVRGWEWRFRARDLDAGLEAVRAELEGCAGDQSAGPSAVVLRSGDGVLLTRFFADAYAASHALHTVCRGLAFTGIDLQLSPDNDDLAGQLDLLALALRPTIGKSDVLDIAQSPSTFPYQVNRHLAQWRPLDLRMPLEVLRGDISGAEYRLRDLLEHTTIRPMDPGHRHRGRLYEEITAMLESDDHRCWEGG